MAGRSNRAYTQEFVDAAVQLALEARGAPGSPARSMRSVSIELGIPWTNLYRWVRQAHPEKMGRLHLSRASRVRPSSTSAVSSGAGDSRVVAALLDERVAMIHKENARLAQENAILKAALVILARDPASNH